MPSSTPMNTMRLPDNPTPWYRMTARRRFGARMGKYLFAVAFSITYLVHVNVVERDHLVYSAPQTQTHRDGTTDGGGGGFIRRTSSSDTAAWTESHSPHHVMDPSRSRISFRLHDPRDVPRPSKFLSVAPYTCGGDDRADLPPSLSSLPVLGFTTTIATDLKIVHVGDSLGQQFVQGFDASLLGTGHERHRRVLREYFYDGGVYSHNCLSVAAPSRGGGVSAYWRVTDLMSLGNRRKEARCAKEELRRKESRVGWSEEQSIELVGHEYRYSREVAGNATNADAANDARESTTHYHADPPGTNYSYAVGPFDAVIVRIPHGWMDVPDITRERIIEAIHLAHENLGVETVVLGTLPFNNNVLTASDWDGIREINAIVRDVARTWRTPLGRRGGVRSVLVQEFGEFTDRLLRESARGLGYNIESPTERGGATAVPKATEYLLDRLPWPPRKWPPSIPMVCAERPGPNDKDCLRNRISTDGIHWCVETLGPRYAASVACLLGCVHNGGGGAQGGAGDGDVRRCEGECNDRFMSVDPVDERWVGNGAVLYSGSLET